MNSNLSWFFDIFAIALLLVFLYTGGKRGFVKSILLITGYIISLRIAFLVINSASPVIYDKYVKTKVVSIVEKQLGDVDVVTEIQRAINNSFADTGISVDKEKIKDIISSNSGNIGKDIETYINANNKDVNISSDEINQNIQDIYNNSIVEKFISSIPTYINNNDYQNAHSTTTINKTLKALTGTKEDAASYIEKSFLRNNLIIVLRSIIFVIVFIISLFVVRLLTRALSIVNKIPLVGPVNTFLGMIFGLLQGLVVIYIIALIIHAVIALSSNQMLVFNSNTIGNTIFFKHIYDFKLL